MPKKIAVIGGGITGLAAARQLVLSSTHTEVTLFEASGILGGALQTICVDGFLIEQSADMFVSEPDAAVKLCNEIGIGDALVSTNKADRFSSIVRSGKLVRTPAGFSLLAPNRIVPVLQSGLISFRGKLRFLADWMIRPVNKQQDQSLESFAVRHFGVEVFERIIQPLVAGIYSAEADELSVQATFKRFVEMEKKYGSLIRGARAENRTKKSEQQSSGARYDLFVAPGNGMQSLVEALVTSTPKVSFQYLSPVISACPATSDQGPGWQLNTPDQNPFFDAVLISTRANVSAKILANLDGSVGHLLSGFKFGSMIVVTIACSEHCFRDGPPRGFGFVVPKVEARNIIACSFSSNKFSGRAPSGKCLLRCFVGGRSVSQWLDKSDARLEAMVCSELGELIGFEPDRTNAYHVIRWKHCMPQYEVGHLERVQQLDQQIANLDGLEVAGCSYSGVGIPACIQSGRDAADRITQYLNNR